MKFVAARRARGFTLVEAIVVMVLTGIVAGIMVVFIRKPVQSYVETAGRAELTDMAEIALRRMTREIHGAVPNSIRLTSIGTSTFLEFIPSKAGGRYLAVEDGAPSTAQNPHPPLSFTDPSATQFEVVGPMPQAPYAIRVNDYIIISNFGTGFTNADAYAQNANNRAVVTAVSSNGNGNFVTLGVNRFAGNVDPLPNKRFIVAGSPVTFACVNDATTGRQRLLRYSGYDFQPNQVDPATVVQQQPLQVQMTLMADNVLGCNFTTATTANRQTALVGLALALARVKPGAAANDLETVKLAQQIHVDNTP
ncbi:prepilin-type cleavage/methylation domain-containing protein [Duganella sp. FT109W]|uniref:Prepilin-type cleavage/methylation domain-containing protein n=1 Tax=Duganella margarita TaxID=2692170 RepID=A0ABW9WPA3_9BURK|nr:prepilin-type N-terminal cleavage/methylation domain-containing protein [Duganella margarita]MYN43042.1 prepilin-type cleavage/methylation domain-containing protein [Duganella margarita]